MATVRVFRYLEELDAFKVTDEFSDLANRLDLTSGVRLYGLAGYLRWIMILVNIGSIIGRSERSWRQKLKNLA